MNGNNQETTQERTRSSSFTRSQTGLFFPVVPIPTVSSKRKGKEEPAEKRVRVNE